MAHDVFISYSSHDKPVADAVCSALENASLRCWIAPRDVQPGRSFAGEITRAIQQSAVMVMIFSTHSNKSEQVLREVQLAVEGQLHIIQFRIEETLLNDDLKYYLSTPHWLDALTPPLQAHLTRLTAAISSLTVSNERNAIANRESESLTMLTSPTASRRMKGKLIIVAAIAIITGLFAVAAYFGQFSRKPGISPARDPQSNEAIAHSQVNNPPAATTTAELSRFNPSVQTADQEFENSLGMRFVPVPATNVLFSVWDTRVQDYEAFVRATGRDFESPPFPQGPTHPVANVNWDDAKAFCRWLTDKERHEGRLSAEQEYRLPTDSEWSAAVGLINEVGHTPLDKSGKTENTYPWGTQWPPPKGAGNYGAGLQVDEFTFTSPVGSFAANKYGLYDLGGNVWQW
ncbi:MAG: SUMF1/EgtB/PvdO family nonheme iron enzyme, partial [Acidobacteriota bacterium]|nr:SUMF1/EgtB/PvdO family nonheme iron enzyme [Acidobacteriota bacterium]